MTLSLPCACCAVGVFLLLFVLFFVLFCTLVAVLLQDAMSAQVVPGKPMGILTWKGEEPSLPSVMLYCHTDVVPVFPVS